MIHWTHISDTYFLGFSFGQNWKNSRFFWAVTREIFLKDDEEKVQNVGTVTRI